MMDREFISETLVHQAWVGFLPRPASMSPGYATPVAPRLLDRQGAHHQSIGRMKLRRRKSGRWHLHQQDPFHTLVTMKTERLLLLVFCVLGASWLVFACLFRTVSDRCDLGADTFLKAFYIAIETLESTGYGVKDPYFNGCYSGVFVVGLAMMWESICSAVILSLIYSRISRSQTRAVSVMFTEKAILQQRDSHWYLMFQVCDIRKHQLDEAHVRLYAVRHSDNFQTCAMRLEHPDDSLGGMLFLSLPQTIVHRIDPWSPLFPGGCEGSDPSSAARFPNVVERQSDVESGGRAVGGRVPPPPSRAVLSEHLKKSEFEILCLVEGTDTVSSSTLQARHSYTSDDLLYHASFKKCVTQEDGTCVVDFNKFHEIEVESNLLAQSF